MTLRRKLTWIFGICFLPLFGQEISIVSNWDYKRKNDQYEKINRSIATTNGYIIAVGETFDASMRETDGLLIVLDANDGSEKVWRQLGGVGDQSINDIVQNPDGTFTIIGHSKRVRGQDGWVAVVDLKGEVLDEQLIDASNGKVDALFDLAINEDGIMMASGQQAIGKNTQPWLLAIDHQGKATTLDHSSLAPGSITGIAADKKDFVIVGTTDKKNKVNPGQIYVQKIDANGQKVWTGAQYFGDRGMQEAGDISYAPINDGYIVCGVTNSKGAGNSDMWLIKIDADGKQEWERTIGDFAGDIAKSVIELGTGGYAVVGHTWSHAPAAKNASLRIYVTDHMGKVVDKNYYVITDGFGNSLGYSVAESAANTNIVLVGNTSKPNRDGLTKTFLSSLNYYQVSLKELGVDEEDDTFGNTGDKQLDLSTGYFIDKNNNNFIEEGERGYVEVEVKNPGSVAQRDVVAKVTSDRGTDLKFWDQLFLGTIGAGQSKKLRVPVFAEERPNQSNYRLNVNIRANGKFGAATTVDVASNTPNPADIIVNRSYFSPASDPVPGEPIVLTIELANIGGAASEPTSADFKLPAGVVSNESERIQLPVIEPRKKHELTFSFSYDDLFRDDAIQIGFDVASTDDVVGPRKTFSLAVPQAEPDLAVVESTPKIESEIIWTDFDDADEFRTIDVNKREIDLKAIALSNRTMNKRNFAVLINGRRSQGQKLDESKLTPPKNMTSNRLQHTYRNKIQLDEGLTTVQIVYYDENGEVEGASSPITFHYVPKGKPNLYVLSIGVKHSDLKYTENDAKAIVDMYQQLNAKKDLNGFNKVFTNSFVTAETTTERAIKRAFLDLTRRRSIKEDDLVVVFISSHGKVVDGNRYVLLPSDYDPQYDEIGTVDFDEDVLERLRDVDAKKLVFIDACHSGSAGSKSYSNEAASKVMNDLINASSGMEIFASCSDHEFSYEDDTWEHGAFTKAIVEAFGNKTVEVDGQKISADVLKQQGDQTVAGSDGVITIEELKQFVQKRVPFLVKQVKNKPQNPTNKSTQYLPKDMGIFMVLK